MAIIQLCRECRFMYHSDSRILCMSCDSKRLTIPASENLVGIVEMLLDRGVEVASARCDVHDTFNDGIGKIVQLQIELGLYPATIFDSHPIPPDWLTYEYHIVVADGQVGAKCLGLGHTEKFIPLDEDELEYQTALTISNLEVWLNNFDPDSFKSVWRLYGGCPV